MLTKAAFIRSKIE